MLLTSFAVLTAAALLGIVLAAGHLGAGRVAAIPGPAWVLHGLLGIAGFAALLLALRGPPRGVTMGVSGFGRFAAVLVAAALLVGLTILRQRLRRRWISTLTLGVHATLAIAGVVVLAGYVLIG